MAKHEFAISVLVHKGLVSKKHVTSLLQEFDSLDSDTSGLLTREQLLFFSRKERCKVKKELTRVQSARQSLRLLPSHSPGKTLVALFTPRTSGGKQSNRISRFSGRLVMDKTIQEDSDDEENDEEEEEEEGEDSVYADDDDFVMVDNQQHVNNAANVEKEAPEKSTTLSRLRPQLTIQVGDDDEEFDEEIERYNEKI